MFSLSDHPHRRFNALSGEWVLVSPHRTKRPWLGQVEERPKLEQPGYDPGCYLCPGNERARGVRNPAYESTFVFDNDFAALLPDVPRGKVECDDLIIADAERGVCRVVCFSPRHDLTLSCMKPEDISKVVDVWGEQYCELGAIDFINYVQIFENRGAMMGASNPHPHGQIWATSHIPNEPAKEQERLQRYAAKHGSCLLCEYLRFERADASRTVFANSDFSVVVPFWAVWPFETLVISSKHVPDIPSLDASQRRSLAEILRRLTGLYDRVFAVPFPYTMGFHQQPTDGEAHPEWHLHAHFYPPLLRSATVRKFMVGFEMLGTPQRDITPEAAAARLREVATTW